MASRQRRRSLPASGSLPFAPLCRRLLITLCLLTGIAATADSGVNEASSPHHSDFGHGQHGPTAPQLPPSGLSPEDDLAYSRFMHHTSGATVLVIAVLLFADRSTAHRYRGLRIGIGVTWLLMGAFLFIFSDLEAWPIGPAGFIDSFSLPTADEWIQHHLLAMIPMVLGLYTILSRWKQSSPFWSYVAAGVAMLGGAALLVHQHFDHPGLDVVNIQHRFFACTSFFIAVSLAFERSSKRTWTAMPYLLPIGLLLLGVQLAFYVE